MYRSLLLHRLHTLKTERLLEQQRVKKQSMGPEIIDLAAEEREARSARRSREKEADLECVTGRRDVAVNEGEHPGMGSLWTEKYSKPPILNYCTNITPTLR